MKNLKLIKNNFINIEIIKVTPKEIMDIRTGTEHDVCRYMINHGNSWISQESMMTSNMFLVSTYLVSQENVREVIKIEEMDPIGGGGRT